MNRIRIVMLMILFSMTASGCMRTYDDLKMIAVRNSNAIWIMNTDGGDRKELTSTAADGICTDASWSADGMAIAYVYTGGPGYLYVVSADTTLLFGSGGECVVADSSFSAPKIQGKSR